MTSGLRERKKQQTREAIHRAAMRLFAERGFDATTIADIAAAADISPRTFFSYFPSKEEAVFAKFEPAFESFDRAMRERPPGTDALVAMREWILGMATEFTGDIEAVKLEARLKQESPAVAACGRSLCDGAPDARRRRVLPRRPRPRLDRVPDVAPSPPLWRPRQPRPRA